MNRAQERIEKYAQKFRREIWSEETTRTLSLKVG